MDRALVHGIAWTAGAKWSNQLLTWMATLAVAKMLDPADYGIVGMGVLVLSLIGLVNEFGVTSAVVTLREMSHDDLRRLNAFAFSVGIVCFCIGVALAAPLSEYFRSPAVRLVVVWQSVTFIVASFQSVPMARLQRRLAFKQLATLEVVKSLVASSAALLLAYYGARYWTLVVGELLASATYTFLLVRACPTGFLWSGFARVRRALVFSGRTLVGNVSWYAYSNTDFLVAGRMLGANALGSYGFAWQLTSLPVEKVTALVGRVTPAFLSVNRENRAIMQRYILRITEGIALITLPATVGIALVAGDLIPTIFGAKWDMVIAPLRILAACMVLRSIVPVVMHAMRTAGDVRFLMWHGIATASVFPFCFVAGARAAGVQGIAMAWLFAYPVALAPLYWRAIRTGLVDGRGYLIALAPAIEGTVAMAVVVMAARSALIASGWSSHVVLLVLEIVTGIVTYSLYLLVRHRGRVRDAVAFVKNGRSAAAVA